MALPVDKSPLQNTMNLPFHIFPPMLFGCRHTCNFARTLAYARTDRSATTATTQQRAFLQTEAASTLKAFIGRIWSAATFRPPSPPAPPPPPPPPPPRRSRVAQPRRMLTSLLVAHLEGPLSSIVAAAAGSFHMAAVSAGMLRERQPWQP